jgi:apolipoprotein N-acyltransferase
MSEVILSILSASLLSFSFSSFNPWLFAWFGFIPLFIALENKTLFRSFIIGYLCGVIFWSLTIYWLIHVTLLGQIVLILYLAFYFGIFSCVVYLFRFLPPNVSLFFIPCTWVLLEYSRSYLFTGFPWAQVGFSQYKNLPIIQIADITGSWGVSFLVVFVNVVFYLALRKRLKLRIFLICACILFLSLAYGFYKLSYKPDLRCDKELVKVSVVQGNIPQNLKWDKQAAADILNNYIELTSIAAKDGSSLIIWPEASVPALWGEASADAQFAQVFSLAGQLNTNLLVGVVSRSGEAYFNSALFIDNLGHPSKIYNKLHLVPFGEYVPFKNTFPFLQTIAPIGDIEPGREYTIFRQPVNFSVLICFEDLFPELSREFIKRGARFLVNITNDAWYKQGSAPYQHFAASVFRAVENRVYLVRAANTGISGFIDPFGRLLSIVQDAAGKNSFVKGYSSQSICLAPIRRTIYNRYGDLFILFCLILDACVIMFVLKKQK